MHKHEAQLARLTSELREQVSIISALVRRGQADSRDAALARMRRDDLTDTLKALKGE